METASSCSTLYTLRFSRNTIASSSTSRLFFETFPRRCTTNLSSFSSFSSSFLKNSNFPRNCKRLDGFTAFSSTENDHDQDLAPELAVLLEVDGVLMDAYRLGNRQAFNIAFQKLGLDCANWSEPVYTDLLRKSSGDEERMLILYFNRIGWPTSLPTSEKGSFVKSVFKEKKIALEELMSTSLPLRPGVEEFIDDAYSKGIPLVILTSYSKSGEKVARSIVEKLGNERLLKVKLIGKEEVEKSLYSQLVLSGKISSDLEEQLAKEASKAASAEKQRVAKEVASMLKLSVDLDTTSSESLQKIVAALRGGAEYVGAPVYNCILITGSKSGVAAAEQIGMPCIVLRNSFTTRGEFPSAKATMDGFGGADLSISRLLQIRRS